MRCPECREGIMYKCRAKMNNGETITVIPCDEQWCSWADEVCLETEIDTLTVFVWKSPAII